MPVSDCADCTGQTRVSCLVCLGKLLPHLDRWLVLDEVLPLLPQVPTREPAVIMAVVGESAPRQALHPRCRGL